jgi:hypothetical protein
MDSIRSVVIAIKDWLDWLPDPVVAAFIFALAAFAALALHDWLYHLLCRLLGSRYPNFIAAFSRILGLTRLALLTLAMIIVIPAAPLRPETAEVLARLLAMAVIGMIGWTVIVVMHIAAEIYLRRFRLDVDDNFLARKHNTQVRVLLRSADVILR